MPGNTFYAFYSNLPFVNNAAQPIGRTVFLLMLSFGSDYFGVHKILGFQQLRRHSPILYATLMARLPCSQLDAGEQSITPGYDLCNSN
jgi:hypothetical protein